MASLALGTAPLSRYDRALVIVNPATMWLGLAFSKRRALILMNIWMQFGLELARYAFLQIKEQRSAPSFARPTVSLRLAWATRPRTLSKPDRHQTLASLVLLPILAMCIAPALSSPFSNPAAHASETQLSVTAAVGSPAVASPGQNTSAAAVQPPAPAVPETHVVAPNESLGQIALSVGYLTPEGTADWRRIWGLNLDKIANPDIIREGMVLNLLGTPQPTPEWPPPPTDKDRMVQAAQRIMDRGGEWYMVGLIMREFIARDISPNVAAGFVGNAFQESSFIPDNIQNGGDWAIGLWQMTYGRASNMKAIAAGMGLAWWDPAAQVEHVVRELQGPEAPAWSQIQSASDPGRIAELICTLYERAGTADMPDRVAWANNAWDAFQHELAHVG